MKEGRRGREEGRIMESWARGEGNSPQGGNRRREWRRVPVNWELAVNVKRSRAYARHSHHGIGLNCPSETLSTRHQSASVPGYQKHTKKHWSCLTILVTPSSGGPVDTLDNGHGARKSVVDAPTRLDTVYFMGSTGCDGWYGPLSARQ